MKNQKDKLLLEKVVKYIQGLGYARVMMIKKEFKLGYVKSAKMMIEMEKLGIIETFERSYPHHKMVLIFDDSWKVRV